MNERGTSAGFTGVSPDRAADLLAGVAGIADPVTPKGAMPLSDPKHAIAIILRHDGPMATAALERRVRGAGVLLEQMARAGQVRCDEGLWRAIDIGCRPVVFD